METTVKIANPIYDTVFSYLLEDKKAAKLLLSAILEVEILELELKSREPAKTKQNSNSAIFSIDFKAKIKDKQGNEQLVIIALQKARVETDIMHFRSLLGMQYFSNEERVLVRIKEKTKDGKEIEKTELYALPIITFYFLGYPLDEFRDNAVIQVSHQLIDVSAEKELKEKNHFIENIMHKSIFVQIPSIKQKESKNTLEKVLSIFEQDKIHEVAINENEYPKEYIAIIQRLKEALADPEIRKKMEEEDKIFAL